MISCVMLCTWPKRAGFIADALASYQLQTHPHRELVVVNDGAPLEPTRDDVSVVNLPSGLSIGEKRNVGLRVASGDWVATWDDDDFSMPERLAELHACAGNASAARSAAMWVADAGLRVAGLVPGACYPTALLRRADALAVGGYPDLSWLEDMELALRFGARGLRTVLCREPFYIHRRHGANASEGKESLARHLARALPQYAHLVPSVQARLDSLRKRACDTLITPA